MGEANTVKVIEICKISPLISSSIHNCSLPLTALDLVFLKFHPTERVFFYQFTNPDHDSDKFSNFIIPKLKQSLSLTLQYFLPVAGNLVWPDDSSESESESQPFFLSTENDSVSFTVAEIDSDFNHLISFNHEISETKSLVPTLQSSDSHASVMALQVTKFSNHDGFSIGISCHHALFDGTSVSIFMKAWSYISKLESSSLPDSMTPSFERSGFVLDFKDTPIKKTSLKIDSIVNESLIQKFHGTFELSQAHLDKLKKRVLEKYSSNEEKLHLSSFVVAYAYALSCLFKSKQEKDEEKEVFFVILLAANVRQLLVLDPPLSSNYFGNCLGGCYGFVERREIDEDFDACFLNIAKKIGDLVLRLKSCSNDKSKIDSFMPMIPSQSEGESFSRSTQFFSVTSSPKLKFYETDFGWGKPKKVEVVSLGNNNISLTETRDGDDGIEVGIVLPPYQMDVFSSLFSKGLY